MRKTADVSTVCHMWANQLQSSCKTPNGSLYFRDNIIFSYGEHFPIAYMTEIEGEKVVYFTTRKFSNTTAKHMHKVRSAIPANYKILYMRYVYFPDHIANIADYEGNIRQYIAKSKNARTTKSWHLNSAKSEVETLKEYANHFKIALSDELQSLIDLPEIADIESVLLADLEKQKEKAKKLTEEKVIKFKKFEIDTISSAYDNLTFLRFNPTTENIETSQYIKVPLQTAKAFYYKIKEILKDGNFENGKKFMHQYNILAITKNHIQVGCHKIKMLDIEEIATLLSF